MPTCSVPSCTNIAETRDWCHVHYMRWYLKGDVLAHIPIQKRLMPQKGKTFEEAFWARIDQSGGSNACWPWIGKKQPTGYAQVANPLFPTVLPKRIGVHRLAYILTCGSIPDGFEVDHTCHTRACTLGKACPHRCCCNPLHLEPVTQQVNLARGRGLLHMDYVRELARQRNRALTHCKRGHLFDTQNTYYRKNGTRCCLACARILDKLSHDRRKQNRSQ